MAIKDNRPIFIQLADRLMDDIIAGRYRPDERIPSVRDFAAVSEVNANTVVRAYEHLEKSEIIYNKRGLGYFVSPEASTKIVAMRREEFFATEMTYFFNRLKTMEMSPDELAARYRKYLDSDNPTH
jgi:DNA-binding transcriptional regulator YhcF (GntR family)